MKSDTVEACLRSRRMYEEELARGPYPTSEVSAIGLTDVEAGELELYLANIAGIASHGPKLTTLEPHRRDEFQRIVAERFSVQWPRADRLITADKAPKLHDLLRATEEARLLIKEILTNL